MDVILAGYNVDVQSIEQIPENIKEKLTPETISAAYARISRDPRVIPELREIAVNEVDKARISNEKIIYDMGHSSIAEHVVFNIDIVGVSRYLVEKIEENRLCSFTEKSQRYVLFKDDYVIPEEIKDNEKLKNQFIFDVKTLNNLYFKLYENLRPYFFEKYKGLAKDKKNEKMIEGWAKEDARYIIPLATETQLGMTLNARNIERIISKCASSNLAETREFAEKLYKAAANIAPSVIKYTKPTEYYLKTREEIRKIFNNIKCVKEKNTDDKAKLIYYTPDGDDMILASLMHTMSSIDMHMCLNKVKKMNNNEKENVFKNCLKYIKSYDPVLREFENANFIFELNISSSCFAQLKRHRMATITVKDYDIELGVAIPPSIFEIGMDKEFLDNIKIIENTYNKIRDYCHKAAPYLLTNSHKRKVLININVRELYHLSRLREDIHAQWDIKNVTAEIIKIAKEKMPFSLMLAC